MNSQSSFHCLLDLLWASPSPETNLWPLNVPLYIADPLKLGAAEQVAYSESFHWKQLSAVAGDDTMTEVTRIVNLHNDEPER